MVRQPVGPSTHWSEYPWVRRPFGPKNYHWSENHRSKNVCHWSDGSLVRKRPIGPKTHWSEKVSLVRKSVIGPKIAGSKGMEVLSRAVDVTDRET